MRGVRLKGAEKLLRTDFVELRNVESELNQRPFRRSRSHSVGGRSHSRRHSHSLSRSGSRSGSSSGSKNKRKKHKSKDSRPAKHGRSGDDRHSAGLNQSRSSKKRKQRSMSASSNSSSRGASPPARVSKTAVAESENGSGEIKTVADLSRTLSVAWSGNLSLKNSAFFINLHLVSGSPALVNMLMFDSKQAKYTNLKLTQRLRLDPSKLDEVRRRIHLARDDWCVLLAVPTTAGALDGLEPGLQERPLKNLVSYLRQKEAAGVVYLPPNSAHGEETGLLHTFAPCEFAHEYLKTRAPKLQLDNRAEDYIVVILVRVNV